VESRVKIGIITCSNRSYAGTRPDTSGALIADELDKAGHDVVGPVVVPDDVEAIRGELATQLYIGVDAVITTGGTGLTPNDVTPEAISPLLDRQIPGIAEALRAVSRERVPTSVLSRGVAGAIGATFVVTLPGSTGGVRDGLAVILPLLDHLHDQLHGGDH